MKPTDKPKGLGFYKTTNPYMSKKESSKNTPSPVARLVRSPSLEDRLTSRAVYQADTSGHYSPFVDEDETNSTISCQHDSSGNIYLET